MRGSSREAAARGWPDGGSAGPSWARSGPRRSLSPLCLSVVTGVLRSPLLHCASWRGGGGWRETNDAVAGVASFRREMNGAARVLHPPGDEWRFAGVASFRWERNGDVAVVASSHPVRGRGRRVGSLSGSQGGEVGRGGKGSEDGVVADRFLVGLVWVRLPAKAVLRLWLESSTVVPTGVISLSKASM